MEITLTFIFWTLIVLMFIIGGIVYVGIGFIIALIMEFSKVDGEETLNFSERLETVLLWPKILIYYIQTGYDD